MAQGLSVRLPAVPGSVGLVRTAVTGAAREQGCGEATIEDIRLACSEAASNAILHGNAGAGHIFVETHACAHEFTVIVVDEGKGIAPRADSPGAGLGLPIIASLADRLEVLSTATGTELRMSFGCPDTFVPTHGSGRHRRFQRGAGSAPN